MENNKNRPSKPKSEEPKKPPIDFVLELLRLLSAAFRVELSEETQAVYLKELTPIRQETLKTAIDRTIREWPEASKFPTVGFILDRVAQSASEELNQLLLGQGKKPPDKPPDWDPELAAELKQKAAEYLKSHPRTTR